MTTYLDSAAVLKLVVDEDDSAVAVEAMANYPPAVTVRVTMVEAASTLERASRAGRISNAERERAWSDFLSVWEDLVIVELSGSLLIEAGQLALRHALSPIQAIHLAAALSLDAPVPFVCFDRALVEAGRLEQMWVIAP